MRSKLKNTILFITGCVAAIAFALLIAFGLFVLLGLGSLQSLNFVSLVVSICTLEATVIIALLVFRLQGRKEQRELDRRTKTACELMLADLQIVFEELLYMPDGSGMAGAAIALKDAFTVYIGDLKRVLSDDSMRELTLIVAAAQDPRFADDDEWFDGSLPNAALSFIRSDVWLVADSPYGRYLHDVADWKDLLNKAAYELIRDLSEASGNPIKEYNQEFAVLSRSDGSPIVEFDSATEHYRVYSRKDMLCDGKFGTPEFSEECPIRDGYVNTVEYKGYIREGRKNGQGVVYSRRDGTKLAEGEWADDKLVRGTEFNMVITIAGEMSLDELNAEESEIPYEVAKYDQITDSPLVSIRLRGIVRCAAGELFYGMDEFRAMKKALDYMYVVDVNVEDDLEGYQNFRKIRDVVDTRKLENQLKE